MRVAPHEKNYMQIRQFVSIDNSVSPYLAQPWDFILDDASGGSTVITLPESPPVGATIWVKEVGNSANQITIQRSGSDLIDGSDSIVITSAYSNSVFSYDGNGNWWGWPSS